MFKSHIKLMVLKQLSKEKLSGYDLMKSLGKTDSKQPSPGYIYPLLNDLQKKEFISVKKEDRRKIYSITNNGKKLLENLESKNDEMLKKMIEMWAPIADKEEFRVLTNFKSGLGKENPFLQDGNLLEKLRKLIFSFYKTKNFEKRKKMKKILEETFKKLEKLR